MISLGLEDWRPEKRNLTLSDFKGIITDPPSTAGVVVTQDSALSVSAYYNGCSIISTAIGVLDRIPYKRVGEDDRERAVNHPLYRLLHNAPNPYSTPQTFWETLVFHAVSWGNGYAEIEWDTANRPVALWLITPDKLRPMSEAYTDTRGRRSSRVWYQYNGKDRIESEDIIHIPGLGYDGICGYSPVALARRTLSVTIAAEEWGASLFANGGNNGAVLEHPGKVGDQAYERLKASIDRDTGPTKAHRLKILEEGMKLSRPIVIPPDDAQFLETRQFQVEEFARWLNLPTWKMKIQQASRPGGNPEISQIDFLTDTLLPWTTRIEQELNRKLISDSQRSTYFVEHLYQKILRADVTTRMSTYKSLFDMKVVNAQWIAKTENLPAPEEQADTLLLTDKVEALGQLVRAGFDPAEALAALELPDIKHLGVLPITVKTEEESQRTLNPQPPGDAPPEGEPQQNARIAAAHRALLMDAAVRYIKVEAERTLRGAKKGPSEFKLWLKARRDEDIETLRAALMPALRVLQAYRQSALPAESLAHALAVRHVDASHEALLALPAKDLAENVERLVASWESERALALAEEGCYEAGH